MVDSQMLVLLGLEDKVRWMVAYGVWNRLLSIEEPVYCGVTLEMLSTFKVDRSLIGVCSAWGDIVSVIQ